MKAKAKTLHAKRQATTADIPAMVKVIKAGMIKASSFRVNDLLDQFPNWVIQWELIETAATKAGFSIACTSDVGEFVFYDSSYVIFK